MGSMHSITPTAANIVDSVIRSRKSVRCFKADPVSKDLLIDILETARAAPSNFNSQPWRVHLLTGKAKEALGEAIVRACQAETYPPFFPFLNLCQPIAQHGLTISAGDITRRSG